MIDPQSPRLTYARTSLTRLDAFHDLVTDAHVRRYLMDGDVFPLEWSEARIHDSEALFKRRGVGLWLVEEAGTAASVGFCGFLEMPGMIREPQLVYALAEGFTRRGYGTEMAKAAIEYARLRCGFEAIVAGVDAVNEHSWRILTKLGFVRTHTVQGAFGDMYICRLDFEPNASSQE